MPKLLEDAVRQIKKKGHSTSSAFAIATSALQKSGSLKKGHNTPTVKGIRRGNMSQAQRRKTKP